MGIQKTIIGLSCSCLIALSANAIEPKAGEWEIETKTSSSTGMEMPAIPTQKACITPEMAKSYAQDLAAKDMPAGCSANIGENTESKLTFTLACEQQGMKIDSRGTVNQIDENQMEMSMVLDMEIPGAGKQTITSTSKQKFISETCSAASK